MSDSNTTAHTFCKGVVLVVLLAGLAACGASAVGGHEFSAETIETGQGASTNPGSGTANGIEPVPTSSLQPPPSRLASGGLAIPPTATEETVDTATGEALTPPSSTTSTIPASDAPVTTVVVPASESAPTAAPSSVPAEPTLTPVPEPTATAPSAPTTAVAATEESAQPTSEPHTHDWIEAKPTQGTEAKPTEGTDAKPTESTEAKPADGTEAKPAAGTEAEAKSAFQQSADSSFQQGEATTGQGGEIEQLLSDNATAGTNRQPFAAVGGVTLYAPADHVVVAGFHESANTQSLEMRVLDSTLDEIVMPTRGRGTGAHTAADMLVRPGNTIYSPVTGTVVDARAYKLYCKYDDNVVIIQPDAAADFLVKVLHISDLKVSNGDRVTAGQTPIAGTTTVLPFSSQIDTYVSDPSNTHVHIETVDLNKVDETNSTVCP